MKLKPKERCPLHGRRDCCGRTEFVRYAQPQHELKYREVEPGVRQYPDGRQVCSKAAIRRRKVRLIRENPVCIACKQTFSSVEDIELAHFESKGMGAAKRRDNWDNIGLMHALANSQQGSMDLGTYLRDFWKPEHCEGTV